MNDAPNDLERLGMLFPEVVTADQREVRLYDPKTRRRAEIRRFAICEGSDMWIEALPSLNNHDKNPRCRTRAPPVNLKVVLNEIGSG